MPYIEHYPRSRTKPSKKYIINTMIDGKPQILVVGPALYHRILTGALREIDLLDVMVEKSRSENNENQNPPPEEDNTGD